MPRGVAEEAGIERQSRVQMRLTPEHPTRERTLGIGRITPAGIQPLDVLDLRDAGVLLSERQRRQ